ncbi:MAG: SRPBCC domain-containing protein [Acidobacteriota bacterium]
MDLRDAGPAEELEITRTFDAPQVMVWKAFTDADVLAKWWGPKGFDWIRGTMELRPGGVFHYGMRAHGGTMEMWGKWVFQEISPIDSMVFLSSFSDAEGNTVRSFFSNDFPLEVRNTLTLEEHAGKTTVTLRGGPVRSTEGEIAFFGGMNASMQQGFGNAFDQLAEYLRGA